jgi:hypothetical protein
VIAASRAAHAYRRVESESRSPLKFVVMLHDGLAITSAPLDTLDVEKRTPVREAWGHIATQPPAMAQAAGGR